MRAVRVAYRREIVAAYRVLTVVCAIFLAGCNQDDNADQAASAEGAAELAELPVGPPPSQNECAKFGEELGWAMRDGDVATFNRLVNWDAIFRRAEHGLDLSEKQARQFRDGLRNNVGKATGLVGSVGQAIRNGGDFRYVRERSRGGRKSVLFRLSADGGLNYIEFPLARNASGNVVATDCYIYLSGEYISQTARRVLLMIIGAENRSFVDRIVGKESDFVRHARDIEQLSKAVAQSDFTSGLAAFRRMPESLQREKFILIPRLLCASNVSEEEYLAAMEDLRKHFPDDPCIDFISIDAYVLREKFAEAMACIDRLSKALDGDAALESKRGDLLIHQGDYPAARAAARRAIDGGDVRPDPYYVILAAALREQQHDETLDLLKQIAQRFNIVLGDLETAEEYAQFIRTPQFQAWQEYVAMNQAQQPEEPPESQSEPIPFG
jgi:hypothetical protein